MRRMHSADLSLLYMIDFMVSKELRFICCIADGNIIGIIFNL